MKMSTHDYNNALFPPIVGAKNANEIIRQSSELPTKKIKMMKPGRTPDLFNSDNERDPVASRLNIQSNILLSANDNEKPKNRHASIDENNSLSRVIPPVITSNYSEVRQFKKIDGDANESVLIHDKSSMQDIGHNNTNEE